MIVNRIKATLLILSMTIFILACTTTENEQPIIEDEYRLTQFSVFDGLENMIQSVTILYNEDDKPVEITTTGSAGEIIQIKKLIYTESGKISHQTNTLTGISTYETVFYYNDADYLIKTETLNEKEELLGTNIYINNEKGNVIEWISEYKGNHEKTHFFMEYDDHDRVIKTSEQDRQGNLLYFSRSVYDELGNETFYTIYTDKGSVDQQLQSYYKGTELIKTEVKDESGNILFYTVYELNDFNKPVKVSSFNQYEDLTVWKEYEYDAAANEIKGLSYNYNGTVKDSYEKKYDSFGNIIELIIYNNNGKITSITRNSYFNGPVNISEKEFHSLIFNQ